MENCRPEYCSLLLSSPQTHKTDNPLQQLYTYSLSIECLQQL